MKCRICGNTLSLQNDTYVCKACNNKFPISAYYENNDVFIAYKETDLQGRRTKESIIAQDIYMKLKSKNINTFYQRISAEGLFGDKLSAILYVAASCTKIIIIVGTSKDSFEKIVEKYREILENKILISVYADMDTVDLPKYLCGLQALNYNKIGAINNLSEIVLRLLNRNRELNIWDLKRKSKRNVISLIFFFVIILLIIGLIYIVFGTTYILPSKKYELAQKLLKQNNYVEAINVFSEIYDYRDSSDKLKNIYNQYVGYYYDEENDIALHINTMNDIKTNIEIQKKSGNIIINETSEIKRNKISFIYNDSENNKGIVNIDLQNDGLKLNINTETAESKFNFGEVYAVFELTNKSDSPLTESITAENIKKLLSKRYTKSEIQHEGFNLNKRISVSTIEWSSYNIENTDIIIDFFGENGYNNILMMNSAKHDPIKFDGEIAFFITAPANIIIPDKIGQAGEIFFNKDNLFIPVKNSFMWSPPNIFGFCISREEIKQTIKEDTLVLCTSKELLGKELFENINKCSWLFY